MRNALEALEREQQDVDNQAAVVETKLRLIMAKGLFAFITFVTERK